MPRGGGAWVDGGAAWRPKSTFNRKLALAFEIGLRVSPPSLREFPVAENGART